MVRINRTQFPAALRQKTWKALWIMGKDSESPEAMMRKLKKVIAPSEIEMFEKRLAIMILLKEGFSYRAIGRAIDVSPSTISFIKHNFTRKPATRSRYAPSSKKKYPKFHHSSKGVGTLLCK